MSSLKLHNWLARPKNDLMSVIFLGCGNSDKAWAKLGSGEYPSALRRNPPKMTSFWSNWTFLRLSVMPLSLQA